VASSPTNQPTRVLGRYAMYEAFAQGGMATLHYGRLLGPAGFSRTVAIKRLHAHLSEDPELVAMFLDEARLAARVHHPNVVQTLDVESSEGEIFVVLDYVRGESLSRLLQEARRAGVPPAPAVVVAVVLGVLEGLHAAHEARDARGEPLEIVHRDVSPHNVLVGTDGIARVLDFGVAKARGRAQTTRGGQLKGKLAYMAPEQLRGKVTRRSDVFAASVVLWEALAGKRLFEGDDDGDVVGRVLHEPIPSPRTYAPMVTPELEAIVLRGLERDPSRRFATAREMALAIEGRVTRATPLEVGAFVERIGGAALAHRAARVARIEQECGDSLGPPRAAGAPDVAPSRRAAASTSDATSPTAVVPELAGGERRAAAAVTPESLATGTATVSDTYAPRKRSILGAVGVAAFAGVVVGLGLALTFAVRGGPPHAGPAGAQSDVPPVTESMLPASAATQAPPDTRAPVDAVEAGPPAATAPVKKAIAPRPRLRAGCTPPYTVDARGLRHYKPECI